MTKSDRHWQDWVTLIVGVWLVLSPMILAVVPPEGSQTFLMSWNFTVTGLLAIALAISALTLFRPWEEWLDIVLGVWLVISPWVLGFTFSEIALWNAILCGVVVAAMGLWVAYETRGEHVL